MTDDSRLGLTISHRRYVSLADAHYAGNLASGAFVLGLFGDVATEVCIRTDRDEGLFASYSDVQFVEAVHAGDVLEVRATVTRVGNRSRDLEFIATVLCRATEGTSSQVLDEPVVATRARGTVVVPG